jgi:hypothetical protein
LGVLHITPEKIKLLADSNAANAPLKNKAAKN